VSNRQLVRALFQKNFRILDRMDDRMQGREFEVDTTIEWLPFKSAQWVAAGTGDSLRLPYGVRVVKDQYGGTAVLFRSQWDAETFRRENPTARLLQVGGTGEEEFDGAGMTIAG
jgi:peptide subunit release factor RF-3